MKTSTFPFLITLLMISSTVKTTAQETIQDQINMAVFAAPEEHREGAKVLGFDNDGNVITLREGTNEFICLADNPASERFHVSCYKSTLEPFIARGRELSAEGKNPGEVFEIREKEAKDGTLQMPTEPATLYAYFGDNVSYDSTTNTIEGAQYRYSIYIPFATQESTGLPLRPNAPGHPWLMNPGTHRAHIMITPPKEN
tara:strand:- start:9536 stop:10132 length:597 start_codon:yes stop_codon:yes gene_type:complete